MIGRTLGVLALLLVAPLGNGVQAQGAQKGWTHGIGTGISFTNLDGETGFDTALGPVRIEVDMDSDEFDEIVETAFGLGGFSSKGKWTLSYSGSYLELEDGESGSGPLGIPVSSTVNQEIIAAEFSAAYRFAVTGKHAWSVLGGVRYVDHSYEIDLEVGMFSSRQTIDNDWTDLLIGITHAYPFSKKLAWTNQLDGGFGGSEGTLHFNTALQWRVAKSWNLTFSGDYRAVDFENASEGASDWYLYDVDEFGFGLGFAYIF